MTFSPFRACHLARSATLLVAILVSTHTTDGLAQDGANQLGVRQSAAVKHIDTIGDDLKYVNQTIWKWAEVGLEEHKSSQLLQSELAEAGFQVKSGLAGMPTAFVASFGQGKPIIGILAEYDALPGLSQQVAPQRVPVEEGKPGHACGHSGLGTGALGAALAVKQAMEQHKIAGTIRLYGTPAEETVIGKVYMTLDGVFDDLDVCLHWHPGTRNEAWSGSSKALVSAKFTFDGTPSHASVSPASGRSALDAVELMNIGANFMREHVKEDARMHYVIIDGGGAPNVVPPQATVWYFCRADSHKDVEYNFRWLKDIAAGAAQMTRTKLTVKIDTDCHEVVPNSPLSDLITTNMQKIGAPQFTDNEKAFARRLQEPLVAQFGNQFALAIDERLHRVPAAPRPSKGSTDVGDISWRIPTGGLRTSCMPSQSPGHSWQNVASIGSSIGEKGILFASKVLAVTAIDLLEDPKQIAAARLDWQNRMKGKDYVTFIPDGQKPPKQIR
jgi:aminobenzoyl-glutamate utilization protein B